MAKASRSSKKQPAFDPGELEDLIFSPAVGSGVGSHLMGLGRDFPTPLETATVATDKQPTVVRLAETTVAKSPAQETSDLATVDRSSLATVANKSTEAMADLPTEAVVSTVVSQSILPRQGREAAPALWITEHGDLVPQNRVKRISAAHDVINSAEESVYDTLWSASPLQSGSDGSTRVVQAGYDYLVKRTRLSKRTIQRIIARLIDKSFIKIERQADIYQRESTVYRIFSPEIVLESHLQSGRCHVVKIGPGFSYARPIDDPRRA